MTRGGWGDLEEQNDKLSQDVHEDIVVDKPLSKPVVDFDRPGNAGLFP